MFVVDKYYLPNIQSPIGPIVYGATIIQIV